MTARINKTPWTRDLKPALCAKFGIEETEITLSIWWDDVRYAYVTLPEGHEAWGPYLRADNAHDYARGILTLDAQDIADIVEAAAAA